ncbi:MAG: ABC transporter ATP-binding protein [Ignavibacteria bacterium]|nr:ABC transporter ATP-binding protein [Ignavibacteria bacterium]
MNSIEVKSLTKKFGSFTSVNDISFEVREGEVFGFLGSNGAGKSTTIKMLCGILAPTSGDALVGGFSINKDTDLVKRNIGYMSQKFSLYNDLTVSENINFFGGIYGLFGNKLEERKSWVIRIADLYGKEEHLTSSLAVGFKQRLALGCAVIHEPQIVFLDEPTGGVDPVSRRKFWDLINELSDKGITVFVTTHYLDEAEFCNRIILINGGKLIASGSPKELKEEYIKNPVYEIDCSDIYKAVKVLENGLFTDNVTIFGNSIHVSLKSSPEFKVNQPENDIEMLNVFLEKENGLKVLRIQKISPSLEDVFVHLIESKK